MRSQPRHTCILAALPGSPFRQQREAVVPPPRGWGQWALASVLPGDLTVAYSTGDRPSIRMPQPRTSAQNAVRQSGPSHGPRRPPARDGSPYPAQPCALALTAPSGPRLPRPEWTALSLESSVPADVPEGAACPHPAGGCLTRRPPADSEVLGRALGHRAAGLLGARLSPALQPPRAPVQD